MDGEPINQALIQPTLDALGFDWHYRAETGSTNADALQHHLHHGREVVAFAESQTAGRGRRGRQWLSPFARNIYCTVGINRRIRAANQGLLSIVTGVALCGALRAQTGLAVRLKWPNDLLLDSRKLGGILIESRVLGDERFFFAIGFGLNLFMSAEELACLDRPATSLSQTSAQELEAVITANRSFEIDGVSALINDFADLDAYHETAVEVICGEQRITGINRGIDETGQLRLETNRGIKLFSAAEISLREAGA